MNRALIAMVAGLAILLLAGAGVLGYRHFAPSAAPQIGGPFALVDGAGKPVTDQQFRGKYLLIYFGYTHCPDACPTALNDMALALDKLGAKRAQVQPIFITIDPERDTGQALSDYVAAFGPDFVGLTGTQDQIAKVNKEFHVYATKHPTKGGDYDMDHSSIIYLMDPDLHFVTAFTHQNSPDEIAAKLAPLVS